jgi:rhamnosyltransferase subunit B
VKAVHPLNVLLPTLGSSGDVHPFIALGLALQMRGHRATIITNPIFQELIEKQGLGFIPIGTLQQAQATIANPDVWHLRKGFAIIAQVIGPTIEQIYRLIEKNADANTVVAYSTLAFGARVAQEKLGVPSASVHLQPSVIRTLADQGMLGNIRLSARHPLWYKKLLFALADAAIIDRNLMPSLNGFRATLGLPPVRHVMDRWMHSPQLVLALFPEWFAAAQADWPPNTHAVGFVQFDAAGETAPLREAEEFLSGGPAPIIFTPGSAGSTMQRFFRESVQAAQRIDARAMLVTNFPEQVPRDLPSGIRVFNYLPFSQVLSRAAMLVYHGGIGTLAQGIRAAVPHLVVPHGYDQFDSGWRIEQLKLGSCIPESRYRAAPVAMAMRAMLEDHSLAARRRDYASRVDSAAALQRACVLIEKLWMRA